MTPPPGARCRTCELVERRDRDEAPRWDSILRTPHWDVVHAFDTSHEGWLVLAARRHVAAVADLSEDEAAELGPLLHRVSRALHAALGCEKTYIAQFAEHPDHRHVHVHVVARPPDLPGELRGPRIFATLGADDRHRVTDERMDEIADLVAASLADHVAGGGAEP